MISFAFLCFPLSYGGPAVSPQADFAATTNIDLTSAAAILRVSYQRARDLVLRGVVLGGRGPDGKWAVDGADLERLRRERRQNGRPNHFPSDSGSPDTTNTSSAKTLLEGPDAANVTGRGDKGIDVRDPHVVPITATSNRV